LGVCKTANPSPDKLSLAGGFYIVPRAEAKGLNGSALTF